MLHINWDDYDYAPTVLCLGATGMLGSALMRVMAELGWDVVGFSSRDFDLTDPDALGPALSLYGGDVVVVNAAAYTAVDECETNQAMADAMNGDVPGCLASFCRERGWRLVHVSTDYVFSGDSKDLYTEEDQPRPINVYGASKWAGEKAIQQTMNDYLIFRLQWLYGVAGRHFVGTILDLAAKREMIQVVEDQRGSPSFVDHMAQAITVAIAAEVPAGIYHLANMGYTSWYGLCVEMKQVLGLNTRFEPVDSGQFPRPAERPMNSRLDISKFLRLNLVQVPSWQTAIREYLNET